jgi:glucose dehydrogenase
MRKLTFLVVATGLAAATIVALASASHNANSISPSAEVAWPWEPAGSIPAGTADNNWAYPKGDLAASQFSYLKQINTSNVSNLKLAWQTSLAGADYSGTIEGAPIVVSGKGKNLPLESGTMFLSADSGLVALNPSTGAILWKYRGPTNANGTWGSFGNSSRTESFGNGQVYVGQQDGSIVAVNAKTGAPVWTYQVSAAGTFAGHTNNNGPVTDFAPDGKNGVVMAGPTGGTSPLRGHLDGVDAKNGRLLWRWFGTPDPGELPYILTWANPAEAAVGASSFWGSLAIDPGLGTVYGQTGNVYPETGRAPGKNLWSASLVALDFHTGALVWYWQSVHHEVWDVDGASPPILINTKINGKVYPGIVGCNKSAYCEFLDRRNGRPLPNFPMKEVKVQEGLAVNNEWPTQPESAGAMANVAPHCATAADAVAGYPTYPVAPNGTPMVVACQFANSTNTEYRIWPLGCACGINYQRSSYSPLTNDFYPCSYNTYTALENISPTDWHVSSIGGGILSVWLSAVNMSTNTMAWQHKFDASHYTGLGSKRVDGVNPGLPDGTWSGGCQTGVMSTGGNLVFVSSKGNTNCGCVLTTPSAGGVFMAFNATTGDGPLWTWQAPDGFNAPPITYSVKGKQYIAIYALGEVPGSPLADGQRDKLTVFSL